VIPIWPGLASAASPEVAIPGTEVVLPLPEGFAVSDRFAGVEDPGRRASVVVLALPTSAEEAWAALDPGALREQGIEVRAERAGRIGGLPARIAEGTQRAGGETYEKRLAIFGDDDQAWLLTGTSPRGPAVRLVERIVVGAELAAASAPVNAGWWLPAPEGLVLAMELPGARLFAPTSELPHPPEAPVLVAAESVAAVEPGAATAEGLLRQTAGLRAFVEVRTVEIVAGGRPWWQTEALAADATTGGPTRVWQRVHFTADGHYLRLLGRAPLEEAELWLARFRAAADELRYPP
jgi:hypothetical protein